MRLELRLEGDAEVKKKLAQAAKQYPDALSAALYQEGMGIWNAAVKRAPVEFSVLRNSAYVGPPSRQGGDIAVETGFGTKYAVFQEETEGLQHPRGGDAHYLRDSIDAATSGYLERLGRRTEQNVERGVRTAVIGAPTTPRVTGGKVSRRLRKARAKMKSNFRKAR